MASKITNTFIIATTSSTISGIQEKWVINLTKKELTPEERILLQNGPKFVVTLATISTTTMLALQAGELNGADCSGPYHDVSRILNT